MSAGPPAPAAVVLRPLGSPLALGMSGLSVASLVMAGHALGWVPSGDVHQVSVLVLVTVVPLQALATVFALLARDGVAAGATAIMSATWAASGAGRLMATPGAQSPALGLAVLAGGGLVALSAATVARTKRVPAAAMALAAAHFAAMGVHELGGPEAWQDAGGVFGLGACAIAAAAAVLSERAEAAVGRVEDEPGVRRPL
jgi:hypothetical protein